MVSTEQARVGEGGAATNPALIVALGFALAIPEGFDLQSIGVAAPKLVPMLHLSSGQMGWVFSASLIGLIIGAGIGGWLADRIGRKPVLVGSVVLYGFLSLFTIGAGDFASLFAVRLATGLGLGGALPNIIAIANEISAPRRRSITVAAMCCAMPIGGAGAALFARYEMVALGWQSIFFVGGVVPIGLAAIALFLLPETWSPSAQVTDRRVVPALFGEDRAGPTVLLWVGFILTNAVVYLLLNWLPTLVVAKGLAPNTAYGASLAFNIGGVIGALGIGILVDVYGLRVIGAAAYALLVFVMAQLSGAGAAGAVLMLSAAAGFLVLGAQYALYAATPIYYPAPVRGTGVGAAVAVGRLGSIAGPLIGGQLLSGGASAGQVVGVMAPVTLAAGVAVLLLTLVGKPQPDT